MGVGNELDSQKTTPLAPGSIAIMQPETHHFAWTKEETVIQLNGVGTLGYHLRQPKRRPEEKVERKNCCSCLTAHLDLISAV